ncbi:MAG TPA: tRNA (adenosine(37)-N6)-threonylcarbamoyltransferase complex transferase subunit TsaD [Dongiaceae bacterium]|jgi:N6-L-threonylcarbamoyladenine synthase|nr:tRNA (adenosine(37)-N6)-threonylcarbamoyltransferase complex transferase subunit TsaD [Dongiaceae bacterium]
MIVLGIETSCDETAAALVDGSGKIHASLIRSQWEEHRPHGGVVPEIAARAHLDHCAPLVEAVLRSAALGWQDIDAVAATTGPGLIGGVIVGAVLGKALALARDIPFVAVNHLEGHALSVRLGARVDFPYMLLLASGGHCQLVAVEGVGCYRRLGTTRDDAAGEAFDKGAKLLGLPQPGGPAIAAAARMAEAPVDLPRPFHGAAHCDFSFSGLKTALRQRVGGRSLTEAERANLAAGLEQAIVACLADRTERALALAPNVTALVAAGGVAANRVLRDRLERLGIARGVPLILPPPELCTDNAAMIAWAGIERLRLGWQDGLDSSVRPRWPLEELTVG